MKQLLGSRILDLWDTWTNTRDMDDDVLSTMEMVVDSIDSKIRFVPGYQKKLYDAVQASLEYSSELFGRPSCVPETRSADMSGRCPSHDEKPLDTAPVPSRVIPMRIGTCALGSRPARKEVETERPA